MPEGADGGAFEVAAEPDGRLGHAEDTEAVKSLLGTLPERWKEAITLRYGLDGADPMTFEVVGERLNVSKARARGLVEQAVERLRWVARLQGLGDMLPRLEEGVRRACSLPQPLEWRRCLSESNSLAASAYSISSIAKNGLKLR